MAFARKLAYKRVLTTYLDAGVPRADVAAVVALLAADGESSPGELAATLDPLVPADRTVELGMAA